MTKFLFKIKKLIIFLDFNILFIFKYPNRYPTSITYIKLTENIIFFLKIKKYKLFLKSILTIIFFLIVDIIKIIYLPIIILVYFSKYRFININFKQIGVLNYHLDLMIKVNNINGYKSIILIPDISEFSFIKKIFKNLFIINNFLIYFFCIPLKHCRLISVFTEDVDHFLDKNQRFIKISPSSNILKQNKVKNQYVFKEKFIKNMKKLSFKKFGNINLSKLFVIHIRDFNYKNTSYQRGSSIKNYNKSINYLIKKKYCVIRLVNSNSTKIHLKSKKYFELNTEIQENQMLQYYLIKNCNGFVCNSSGPSSIGSLFNTDTFHTNIFGVNTNAITKKSTYIFKKIKYKNKILNFKDLVKNNIYNGIYLSEKFNSSGFIAVENSENEIFMGLKDFLKQKKNISQSLIQRKFKEKLPNYMEMKLYNSNISNSFMKINKKLFRGFNL